MKLCQYFYLLLVVVLTITKSLGLAIPSDQVKPPHAKRDTAMRRSVEKRDAIDTINICYDCDGPCLTAIAGTSYQTATNYFNAITNQLNLIFSNSDLPLLANTQLITTSTTDFVLDPSGHSEDLQAGMNLYWEGSRIAARLQSNCAFSILITVDPIFSEPNVQSGMAYVDSLCTEFSYSISMWENDIATEAARVAHEMSHAMDINHVADGEITFTTDLNVMETCYPVVCSDPSGQCIQVANMESPPPTMYSPCARAIFFAWRAANNGNCIGPMVTYYDVGSGGK